MSKGGGRAPASEPEFVQLLSPSGERVDHPDYSVDFTDDLHRHLM